VTESRLDVTDNDRPGHPAEQADGTVTSAPARAMAGLHTNIGTPYTTPVTGQGERAAYLGMPEQRPPRMGFFTDTSVCIGCKACEVACKVWNQVPADAGPTGSGSADLANLDLLGMSYDNTGDLGANT
jgi:formate dehydrogenase iron-sulfur subunit